MSEDQQVEGTDRTIRRVTTTTTTTTTTSTKLVPVTATGLLVSSSGSNRSEAGGVLLSRVVISFDPALASLQKVVDQWSSAQSELGELWQGWTQLDERTVELHLRAPLRKIPENFLRRFGFITSIDFTGLAESMVEEIGSGFLAGCVSLNSVTGISRGLSKVERLGDQFLKGCMSLKNVDLSSMVSSVQSVGAECMENCPAPCPFSAPSASKRTSAESEPSLVVKEEAPRDNFVTPSAAARREVTPPRGVDSKRTDEIDESPTTVSLRDMIQSALLLSRVREEEEFRSVEALKATVKAQDAIIHNQQKATLKRTSSPLNRRRNSPLHELTPVVFDGSCGPEVSRQGSESTLSSLNKKPRESASPIPLSSLAAVTSYRYTHVSATAEENNRLRGFDRSTNIGTVGRTKHLSPHVRRDSSPNSSRSGSPYRLISSPSTGADIVVGVEVEPRGRKGLLKEEEGIRWRHFESGEARQHFISPQRTLQTRDERSESDLPTVSELTRPQERDEEISEEESTKATSSPVESTFPESNTESTTEARGSPVTDDGKKVPFLLRKGGSRRRDDTLLSEHKEPPQASTGLPSDSEELSTKVEMSAENNASGSSPISSSLLTKIRAKQRSESSPKEESNSPNRNLSDTHSVHNQNRDQLTNHVERHPDDRNASLSPNPEPPAGSGGNDSVQVGDAEKKKPSVLDRLRARREKEQMTTGHDSTTDQKQAASECEEAPSSEGKKPSLLAKLKQRRAADASTESPPPSTAEAMGNGVTSSGKPSLLEKMRSRRLASESSSSTETTRAPQ